MQRMDAKLSRGQLAQLHIWPKELGLDDSVRQDIQREQTGKESCRDMTRADYLRLRSHYARLRAGQNIQARPKKGQGASESLKALYAKVQRRGDKPGLASVAALQKIIRMLSLPVEKEETALNKALNGHVGVSKWQWLDPNHAWKMIEALKARQGRQRRSA